jgi:hypothetical protein
MSASNLFETALLNNIFNNSTIANIGDATGLRGSTTAGSLYVALCTADPTEAGTGSSMSETTYTNYARVAVARTSGGWTISGNTVSNTGTITFPTCGTTGATVTYFAICDSSTGGGLLFSGALTSSLAVSSGVTPTFAASALTTTAD